MKLINFSGIAHPDKVWHTFSKRWSDARHAHRIDGYDLPDRSMVVNAIEVVIIAEARER